jgi:hypothetical protein
MEACERLATQVPRASCFRVSQEGCSPLAVAIETGLSFRVSRKGCSPAAPLGFSVGEAANQNTIDLQWEMRRELQCKALRRREKSRGAKNNGEQWKKQCAEQWKQSEIRARADASPGHIDSPRKQSPAAERRRARISVTRISAIAHPSAERTLKSAPRYSRRAIKEACNTRSYAIALPFRGRRSAHTLLTSHPIAVSRATL